MAESEPHYRRVLLKLSGEALMGDLDYGIEPKVIQRIAAEIAAAKRVGDRKTIGVQADRVRNERVDTLRGLRLNKKTIDKVVTAIKSYIRRVERAEATIAECHRRAGGKDEKGIRKLLKDVRDDYDLVFLDCPPGITLLSESVLEAAHAVLVPVIPTTLSARTLDQLTAFCAKQGLAPELLLPFLSMVDRRKRMHLDLVEQLSASHRSMLRSYIPDSADVDVYERSVSGGLRVPCQSTDERGGPRSGDPRRRAFGLLTVSRPSAPPGRVRPLAGRRPTGGPARRRPCGSGQCPPGPPTWS